jgi:hypothetical protein
MTHIFQGLLIIFKCRKLLRKLQVFKIFSHYKRQDKWKREFSNFVNQFFGLCLLKKIVIIFSIKKKDK